MSDALSDIAKRDKNEKEADAAIELLAKRIDNQTKHIIDRDRWELETDDFVEVITDLIYEKLEEQWVNRQ